MSDEIVWQIINQQFCSFKLSTREKTFCRDVSKVRDCHSQMVHQACLEKKMLTPNFSLQPPVLPVCLPLNDRSRDANSPLSLANSRYATVRAHPTKGTIYLYTVAIPNTGRSLLTNADRSERAHQPSKLWEKRRLSPNYQTALKQIDDMLQYWPGFLVHKAKIAIRMRRIAKEEARLGEKTVPKLAPKIRKREATRERKAEAAAKLERTIERELLQRLREGAYGDQPLNVSESIWKKVLNEMEREGDATRDKDLDKGIEDEEEEENENEYELEEDEEDGAVEYVSDLEESDDDLDDIEDWLGSDQESDEEDSASEASDDDEQDAKKKPAAGGKRKEAPVRKPKKGIKRRKEIEHEVEYEPRAQELAF
ncbi:putative Protein MAK16 [Seiridium unicorne]|uniref:Protein MAK16 n=1 Tax=Seiridium unicorne TaxID=138068 RepID=A0ABR2V6D1_9PEZI